MRMCTPELAQPDMLCLRRDELEQASGAQLRRQANVLFDILKKGRERAPWSTHAEAVVPRLPGRQLIYTLRTGNTWWTCRVAARNPFPRAAHTAAASQCMAEGAQAQGSSSAGTPLQLRTRDVARNRHVVENSGNPPPPPWPPAANAHGMADPQQQPPLAKLLRDAGVSWDAKPTSWLVFKKRFARVLSRAGAGAQYGTADQVDGLLAVIKPEASDADAPAVMAIAKFLSEVDDAADMDGVWARLADYCGYSVRFSAEAMREKLTRIVRRPGTRCHEFAMEWANTYALAFPGESVSEYACRALVDKLKLGAHVGAAHVAIMPLMGTDAMKDPAGFANKIGLVLDAAVDLKAIDAQRAPSGASGGAKARPRDQHDARQAGDKKPPTTAALPEGTGPNDRCKLRNHYNHTNAQCFTQQKMKSGGADPASTSGAASAKN